MCDTRRNRRNRPLQVETLETMTLLSGMATPALTQAIVAASHGRPKSAPVTINVRTHGTYSIDRRVPDAGTTYQVITSGYQARLGTVTITGTLSTPGFIRSGQVHGTLHLVTAGGRLELDVNGPSTPGFSRLPRVVTFTASHGTGKFAGLKGSGTIDVTATPDPTPKASPALTSHGRITLVVHYPRDIATV